MTLRRAILPLLSGVPLTSAESEVLRATPARSWQLLVTAECCALPLMARLRQTGTLGSLPLEVREIVSQAELQEMQRVMAARAELRTIDTIAAALGIEVTVLKGGAVAAETDRPALDLGDVDLLCARGDAARLTRALLDAGWREKHAAGISALGSDDAEFNHFVPLLPPGDGIAVELHQRVDYGGASEATTRDRTRPLRGARALHRFVGAAAVVTSLEHSVIQHPHRRGHLRDLVLLSDAFGECSDDERRALPSLVAGARFATQLGEMLALATSFARGERVEDPPAIQRAVARKYLLALGDDAQLTARVAEWWRISYIALDPPRLRASLYGDLLRSAFARVPRGSRFGAAGGWVVRSTYRTALTAVAVAQGPAVRRDVYAVLRAASGS